MRKIGIFLVLIAFFAGCISSSINKGKRAKEIILKERFTVNENIEKSIYSSFDNTYYLSNNNKISIYRNKKLVNTFGGSGFSQASFNKLSDIYLSSDNKVIALDSFAKTLKKIDNNGHLIAEVTLKNCSEPKLLCSDNQNRIYIYDGFQNEIIVYDDINAKPSSRWGRYNNDDPQAMYFQRNQLILQTEQATTVYSPLGYQLEDFSEKVWLDHQSNRITVENNIIKFNDSKPILPLIMTGDYNLSVHYNFIIINNSNEILRYEIIYEKID